MLILLEYVIVIRKYFPIGALLVMFTWTIFHYLMQGRGSKGTGKANGAFP